MANVMNGISVLKSGGTQFIEVTVVARNVEQDMSICTDISQYLVDPYGEIVDRRRLLRHNQTGHRYGNGRVCWEASVSRATT